MMKIFRVFAPVAAIVIAGTFGCTSGEESAAASSLREPQVVLAQNHARQTPESVTADRKPEVAGKSESNLVKKEDFLTLVEGEVPIELKTAMQVRNYSFGVGEDGGKPELRFQVFNLSESEMLTFEIRTLFFREDGSVIDVTPWSRASVNPRQTWRYAAVPFTPYAVDEQVQLRLIEEKREDADS